MTGPILFSADEPLVIRPIKPHGFSIETKDGRVIATTAIDAAEDATIDRGLGLLE